METTGNVDLPIIKYMWEVWTLGVRHTYITDSKLMFKCFGLGVYNNRLKCCCVSIPALSDWIVRLIMHRWLIVIVDPGTVPLYRWQAATSHNYIVGYLLYKVANMNIYICVCV